MQVFINANEAEFKRIGFGAITGGWLSNGWTGEQLIEEYCQLSGASSDFPQHFGWGVESVTKQNPNNADAHVAVANFAYMLLGRTAGSGSYTKNPHNPGIWRSISRGEITSFHSLQHPSALDYQDNNFTYKGQDKRFLLARWLEYRFYLTKVPNAADAARVAAAADNLPVDFNMELRVFL